MQPAPDHASVGDILGPLVADEEFRTAILDPVQLGEEQAQSNQRVYQADNARGVEASIWVYRHLGDRLCNHLGFAWVPLRGQLRLLSPADRWPGRRYQFVTRRGKVEGKSVRLSGDIGKLTDDLLSLNSTQLGLFDDDPQPTPDTSRVFSIWIIRTLVNDTLVRVHLALADGPGPEEDLLACREIAWLGDVNLDSTPQFGGDLPGSVPFDVEVREKDGTNG
jgi:hypothetical protein